MSEPTFVLVDDLNTFTKEELEIIRTLINNTDEKALTSSEEIMVVQSKIQCLIDNYCEHKPRWERPDHVICYCSVCKKILEL